MRRCLVALSAVMILSCNGTSAFTSTTETPTTTSQAPTLTTLVVTTTESTVAATTTTMMTTVPATIAPTELTLESFPVPAGSRPHDVAPAADGGVWYTAQDTGELGWLDPSTGETIHVDLGDGSAPHGVIVDEEGLAWITDGGLNAIVAVNPDGMGVTAYPLPDDRPNSNLNTASFDGNGLLWFTGQNGIYGSLDPTDGAMIVYDAPEGRGPYGVTTTPEGVVYYASLAGSHIARVEPDGSATVLEPPTPEQGARRVWSDSESRIWVSEWNSGQLSRYTPESNSWETWPLPGDNPETYAVFVDDGDIVWASDFGSNSMVRFDPATERFETYVLPHDPGNVRQILGRPGEVWFPESAADNLIVIRTSG
jgi:virginiamycin B lyase